MFNHLAHWTWRLRNCLSSHAQATPLFGEVRQGYQQEVYQKSGSAQE